MIDFDRLPKKIGNLRFTFTNSLQTKQERQYKYAQLRKLGFTPVEARSMRDYREDIIQKRIAILEVAREM